MAQQKDKTGPRDRDDSATAVAERNSRVTDVAASAGGADRAGSKGASAAPAPSGGFFEIYKPSQGARVRMWSGAAYGALVAWFAYFIYERLAIFGTGSTRQIVQVIGASIVIAGFGLLGYWLLGLNRRVCDFLIATEGEMKKVNWTSRKEIIGSTKVVIFVLVFMSVLLFVVDIVFMVFFTWIGVLKGGSVWEMLFGR